MHCKSGIDRAGLMSALYAHFELGQPIEQAARQLGLKYLHLKTGRTGVLDELFARYLRQIAPTGVSFLQWVESDAYDPAALTREFHATWWGNLLVDKVLRRE
jgi:protein tyrosine/serine phosphatase